jgi:putative transposase
MNLPSDHRKQIRHFDNPSDCRELTFSCYQRLPLLTNDTWRQMLAESIDRAVARYRFGLAAFVFMPEHVHLLVFPYPQASKIDRLLFAIKRPFSFRIKLLLTASKSPLLEKLTIRQRPSELTFRYWQEGPGYDRNLYEPKSVLSAIDYIHQNPVRRGLCQSAIEWRWSSARYFQNPSAAIDPALPRIHPLPAEFLA